jgi:PEGA domain
VKSEAVGAAQQSSSRKVKVRCNQHVPVQWGVRRTCLAQGEAICGYHLSFSRELARSRMPTIRPAEKQTISVKMSWDPRFRMPSVFSEIKLSVTPDRAAVFVDGQFVGHVGEFGGVGKSLLIAPGHRKLIISLPGYQTFSTEIDLAPNQKFQIKTDLIKESTAQPSAPSDRQ